MKNIHKKILGLAILTSVFTACDKNIDLQPTDTISTETAIQTYDDLDRAAIGAYSNIAYQQSIAVNSSLADEARYGADNSTRNYYLEARWLYDSTDGGQNSSWENLYNVIDRVNRALSRYDDVTTSTPTEAANKPRLRGELLAIRAFAHAELLRWFSAKYEPSALGVVLKLQSSILEKPQRNTFGEVMAQVNADLAEADALIPSSSTDLFRITKPAVAAIRARAALYAKDWANAALYAGQAIAAKPTLATGATYSGIWTDANTSEVLFQLRRNANAGSVRTIYTDDNLDVFLSPSYKLLATYNQLTDIRYPAFFFNDRSVATSREPWKVNKYPGQTATNRFNNVKVFRTSEMYLILAEAQAELNDLSSGASSLNAVRAARITGYVPVTTFTKQELIDAILLERYKELAFEGHRFFDLKRRELPVVRGDQDITVGAAVPKTLNVTDRQYALPIPSTELFANPNIQQNPGY